MKEFQICFKDNEGVFLSIFPNNTTSEVIVNNILHYLDINNISDYDINIIKNVAKIKDKEEQVKISNNISIKSINESVEIKIDNDKLKAYITFYPASKNGKLLTIDELIKIINNNNIRFGFETSKLQELLIEKEYFKEILFANGIPMKLGKDAYVEYYFPTEISKKPKINEDGSVNFHSLDLVANVKKGDLLAKLHSEIEGEKGIDVCGNAIIPPKVKKGKILHGKNIILSDDATEIYAEKDGYVKLEENKVIVHDSFVLNSVDPSTGDVKFDGSVIVKGNIITGFKVEAKGNIEVEGIVEGAILISEANIILKRGIQGMGRGHIEAKGNVIAKFIENSYVKCNGYVQSEAILHSHISAKGDINVDGKKGMIIGGEIRSGTSIATKILGSHMGTVTIVDVGIDPQLVDEYNTLGKEVQQEQEEIIKMNQIVTLLQARKMQKGTLEPDKIEMLQKATRNKIVLESNLNVKKARHSQLLEELEKKNEGIVKVRGSAYPGVRITINNVKYYVREEIQYCSLYRDGADIKVSNY